MDIDKIFDDFDDEEYSGEGLLCDLLNNKFNKDTLVIEISLDKWDEFVNYTITNNLNFGKNGIERFKRYLKKCEKNIYLFIKYKLSNGAFRTSFYSDVNRFEDGDYLIDNSYKEYYDFKNNELVPVDDLPF